MRRRRTRARSTAALAAAAALAVTLVPALVATTSTAAEATAAPEAAYTNPVTEGVVDTFPDPAMIRGKDGAWYAYGTQNPIFESQGDDAEHILPILRTTNLVDYEYVGDVIEPDDVPSTWKSNSRAWAPDIRYVDGEYVLTYGLSTGGLAVATAPTPTGPWAHRDALIVPPAAVAGCPTGNIDQSLFTDDDGTLYLYWGSYDIICATELDPGTFEPTGQVTQVAQGRRMEGGYVVRHDDLYYLMYSDAGCCDGAASGYSVKVGRSESPRGPFVDDAGVDLMSLSSKGGFVMTPNGNGFTGVGHNSVQTDLSGQDWIVYHGIENDDADFPPLSTRAGTLALSKRPLMIDRLDWIDGWPVVNAGAGPSRAAEQAPVTTGPVDDGFDDLDAWDVTGDVSLAEEQDAGGFVRLADGAELTSTETVDGDVRVQADLRVAADDGAVGLRSGASAADGVTAWVDAAARELRVDVGDGADAVTGAAAIPSNADLTTWHVLTLDRVGDDVTARLSADDLGDAVAVVRLTAEGSAAGAEPVMVVADGAGAVDNVSAVPAARPVTERVADPQPGELLEDYSDEFDGTVVPGSDGADDGWSWVRKPASGPTLKDGALVWPTQAAEVYTTNNTASVLLRDAPRDDFMVETELTFDGTKAAQQAGFLLYDSDDRYIKLTHSVLPLNRTDKFLHVTEFGREGERPTTTPPTNLSNGPMFGAAPAATTWLRLYAQLDEENDEYDVRMASSTDGETWQWGGTWSLRTQRDLRIGLVSMNATGATATFDYVRTYAMGGEESAYPRSWPAPTPYGAADGREELQLDDHNSQVLDLELRPQDSELGRVWMRDAYVNRFEVDGESLYVATGTTRAEGLETAAPWNDGIYVWTAPSIDGPWSLVDTTGIRPDQTKGKVWSPEFVDENEPGSVVVADWQEYVNPDDPATKRGNAWAPEVHYIDGTWYIVACMGDDSTLTGSFVLKSEGGIEGPYRNIEGNVEHPLGEPVRAADPQYYHIDGSLFEDDDANYLVLHNGLYARMTDDMENLETPTNLPTFTQQTYDPNPYLEGAYVTKVGSKYYLSHAVWANRSGTDDDPSWSYLNGTGEKDQYDTVVAVADSFEGPYSKRWTLGVGAGHDNLFVDEDGGLWATFFRNPAHGYWADPARIADAAVPGVVRLEQAGPTGTMLYVQRPGAEPSLDLDVTVQPRCLAGKAYVAVRASNGEDVPVDVTLSTPYGEKSFADVGPGSSAYQSFPVRAASAPAGTVTVNGAATVDGAEVSSTTDASFDAVDCG